MVFYVLATGINEAEGLGRFYLIIRLCRCQLFYK